MRFSAVPPSQARSWASVGGCGKNLRRRARRVRGAVPQPGGHSGGCGPEPCGLGGAVGFVDRGVRRVVVDDGQPPSRITGAYWTPATTGTPRNTVPAG